MAGGIEEAEPAERLPDQQGDPRWEPRHAGEENQRQDPDVHAGLFMKYIQFGRESEMEILTEIMSARGGQLIAHPVPPPH
jgi:hypothetical protein